MKTLEELAEKHCCSKLASKAYIFTLDQLRDLIKEVVGEPARVISWNPLNGIAMAEMPHITNGYVDPFKKPIHALNVDLG